MGVDKKQRVKCHWKRGDCFFFALTQLYSDDAKFLKGLSASFPRDSTSE